MLWSKISPRIWKPDGLVIGLPSDNAVPTDYDGDWKSDIAVWRPDGAIWYILPSNAPGTYWEKYWGVSTDVPTSSPVTMLVN